MAATAHAQVHIGAKAPAALQNALRKAAAADGNRTVSSLIIKWLSDRAQREGLMRPDKK